MVVTGGNIHSALDLSLLSLAGDHGHGHVIIEENISGIPVIAGPQLSVGVVAPSKQGAVGADGQHMGAAGRHFHNVGQLLRGAGAQALIHQGRRGHIAHIFRRRHIVGQAHAILFLIVGGSSQVCRVVGVVGLIIHHLQIPALELVLAGVTDTKLAPVIHTETPDGAGLGEHQRIAVPGVNRAGPVAIGAIKTGNGHQNRAGLNAAQSPLAQLAVEVIAPGVDRPGAILVLHNGQSVVPARRDGNRVLQVAGPAQDPLGAQSIVDRAAAAQLAHAVVTPGQHLAVGLQGHRKALAHLQVRGGPIHRIPLRVRGLIPNQDPQHQGIPACLIINAHGGHACPGRPDHIGGNDLHDTGVGAGDLKILDVIVDLCVLTLFPQQELVHPLIGERLDTHPIAQEQGHLTLESLIGIGDAARDYRCRRRVSGAVGTRSRRVVYARSHIVLTPVDGGHLTQLATGVQAPGRDPAILCHDCSVRSTAAHGDGAAALQPGDHLIDVGAFRGVNRRKPVIQHIGLEVGSNRHTQLAAGVHTKDVHLAVLNGVGVSIPLAPDDHGVVIAGGDGHHIIQVGGQLVGHGVGIAALHIQLKDTGGRDLLGAVAHQCGIGILPAEDNAQLTIQVGTESTHRNIIVGILNHNQGMAPSHGHIGHTGHGDVALTEDAPAYLTGIIGRRRLAPAQLAVFVIAPSEQVRVLTQGKGLIRSGVDLHDAGQVALIFAQHRDRYAGIIFRGIGRLGGQLLTQLALLVGTPGIGRAARDRHGVLVTGGDAGSAGKVLTGAALPHLHLYRTAVIGAVILALAQLTPAVPAPGVNVAVGRPGQHMVPAHRDFLDQLADTHLHREGGHGHLGLALTDAQLAVGIAAPGPDRTVSPEGHGEIIAALDKRLGKVVGILDHHIERALVLQLAAQLPHSGILDPDSSLRVEQPVGSGIKPGVTRRGAARIADHHHGILRNILQINAAQLGLAVTVRAVAFTQVEAHIVVAANTVPEDHDVLIVGDGEQRVRNHRPILVSPLHDGQRLFSDLQSVKVILLVEPRNAGVPTAQSALSRGHLGQGI